MLSRGYGNDPTPDLVGITLEGDVSALDRATERIAATTRRAGGEGAVLVVLGTGSNGHPVADPIPASSVERGVEEALGEGSVLAADTDGIFLDWGALARDALNASRGISALREGALTELDPSAYVYSGLSIAFASACPGSGVSPSPSETSMPEMNM